MAGQVITVAPFLHVAVSGTVFGLVVTLMVAASGDTCTDVTASTTSIESVVNFVSLVA